MHEESAPATAPDEVAVADTMVLEKYELLSPLGRGGMAEVHVARRRGEGADTALVAIKSLRDHETGPTEEIAARLLDEGRLVQLLDHPNIVRVLDVVDDDGPPYLVLELLDGLALRKLRERTCLPHVPSATRIALEAHVLGRVLAALHYAHELRDESGAPCGIVHRDVSPDNVLVTSDGTVKLLDFGIAKGSGRSVKTRTGVFLGKVKYAAPEQLMGAALDRRTDVYAVGALLWEALAGRRMWGRVPLTQVYSAALRGELPSLRECAPGAPEALVAVAERALRANPDARYASAEAMRLELELAVRAAALEFDDEYVACFLPRETPKAPVVPEPAARHDVAPSLMSAAMTLEMPSPEALPTTATRISRRTRALCGVAAAIGAVVLVHFSSSRDGTVALGASEPPRTVSSPEPASPPPEPPSPPPPAGLVVNAPMAPRADAETIVTPRPPPGTPRLATASGARRATPAMSASSVTPATSAGPRAAPSATAASDPYDDDLPLLPPRAAVPLDTTNPFGS